MRTLAVLAVFWLVACGPLASGTATRTPSTAPDRVPPLPTRSAVPALVRYVDADLGFRLDLPAPWRPSACNVPGRVQAGIFEARLEFVAVNELDQTGSDVGSNYDFVAIAVSDDKEHLTPRQWIAAGRVGAAAGTELQDVTFAGHAAVRLSPSGSYYFVDRDRMWAVGQQVQIAPGLKPAADAIVASFRLLSDEERRDAQQAATPSPAPRSIDDLINGLAAAFRATDAAALGALMTPCFGNAIENGGASFVTRTREMSDLRQAFSNGLTVTVQTRPIKGDPAIGSATVGSTWTQPGQPERHMDLSLRADDATWRWVATIRLAR